jgi:hypothetical protein
MAGRLITGKVLKFSSTLAAGYIIKPINYIIE